MKSIVLSSFPPQGKSILNSAAQRSSARLRYSISPHLFILSPSVLSSFVPFVPIKIHAEQWVMGLQTHTAQFGFNLIPPGPPNSISDP